MFTLKEDKRKSRIVMFRLSADEYSFLQSTCLAANCRSMSDYMRAELLGPVHSALSGPAVENRLSEIDGSLAKVLNLIQHISGRISAIEPALTQVPPSAKPMM
jgi:hypothetical protein